MRRSRGARWRWRSRRPRRPRRPWCLGRRWLRWDRSRAGGTAGSPRTLRTGGNDRRQRGRDVERICCRHGATCKTDNAKKEMSMGVTSKGSARWAVGKSTIASAMLVMMLAFVGAGVGQVIHPQAAPNPADFTPQPPVVDGLRWAGPSIGAVPVTCWHLEPDNPRRPVGGTDQWQKVSGFVPVTGTDRLSRIGAVPPFQQTEPFPASGGGANSTLSARDVPPDIFLGVKAHPVYRLTSIRYPVAPPAFPPFTTQAVWSGY